MSRSSAIEILMRHGFNRGDAEIVANGLIAEATAAISRRLWVRLFVTIAVVFTAEVGVAAVVRAVWSQ